jgi:hypothetical protein
MAAAAGYGPRSVEYMICIGHLTGIECKRRRGGRDAALEDRPRGVCDRSRIVLIGLRNALKLIEAVLESRPNAIYNVNLILISVELRTLGIEFRDISWLSDGEEFPNDVRLGSGQNSPCCLR